MKVFVAGATGAIGKQLIPLLISHGHEVIGLTRSESKTGWLDQLGAQPVVADALNRDDIIAAVGKVQPDVIVHQLTALSAANIRRFDQTFALTNRLRTEGTDNLLAAAAAAGVGRFVAQSYTGWPNDRVGGPVKTEEDALDPSPPKQMRATLDAIRYLERVVPAAPGINGVALRYGTFYGPGTGLNHDGEQAAMVRKRFFPIVGSGGGVWSFVHISDAAQATLAAIEQRATGVYNIVDDEPAPVREWLPALAAALGAKPPRHIPSWLARLMLGEPGVSLMIQIRGSSNAKAKRDLGWQPRYPSWREGFTTGL